MEAAWIAHSVDRSAWNVTSRTSFEQFSPVHECYAQRAQCTVVLDSLVTQRQRMAWKNTSASRLVLPGMRGGGHCPNILID